MFHGRRVASKTFPSRGRIVVPRDPEEDRR